MTDTSSPQHAVAFELGRLSIALSFFDRHLPSAHGRVTGNGLVAASDALVDVRYTSERINLIRRAIAGKPADDPVHLLTPILDARMSVNDRRNRLMHDVWAVAGGQYVTFTERRPSDYPPDFKPTPVEAAELADMTTTVQAAAHALLDWIWETHPAEGLATP